MTNHVLLRTDLCTACGSCMETCPKKVLGKVGFLRHQHAHVDQAEACVGCLKCVSACPQQAMIARSDHDTGNLRVARPSPIYL
ncbi:MAG: ferredoxin family protein [Ignavibacteriales bacterium]